MNLIEAEQFFDQDLWIKLLALGMNSDTALHEIAMTTKGPLVYYAQKQAEKGVESSKLSVLRYELEDRILALFRERLVSGELVASGFVNGSPTRQTIDSELWTDLVPKFLGNEAKSISHHFTKVKIAFAFASSTVAQDVLLTWMQEQNAAGRRAKKVLEAAALERFGETFRVRKFDAAYKAVFGHPRGRPRKHTE